MLLQWNISVLLGRIRVTFVGQHFQCVDQARTGFFWFDHIVNISALCGNIRTGKFFLVICDQFCFLCNGVTSFFKFLAEDYFDRPSGPMTAISAVGHARFKSLRICLDDITQYAPP